MQIKKALLFMTLLVGNAIAADEAMTTAPPGVDPDVSFSGIRHIESIEGAADMMIRQAPGKSRIEMQNKRTPMTLIQRHDLGVNYMLIPRMKMYQEIKPDQLQIKMANLSYLNVEEAGSDEIGGETCAKYRAQFENNQGHRGKGHYWVSTQGIMMKVEMTIDRPGRDAEQVSFVMSDVEVGPQDPAQFEVPDGFAKMN